MASTDFRVLTPERVSLQYDIAGIGSRGAAAFVDALIQGVLMAIVVIGLLGVAALSSAFDIDYSEVIIIIVLALATFLVTLGYSMLFEVMWNGQTPGKRMVGVRVLRENGYP